MYKIDYKEIDGNMRRLVYVLDKFDGPSTVGSRGGHTEEEMGRRGHSQVSRWHMSFTLDSARGMGSIKTCYRCSTTLSA